MPELQVYILRIRSRALACLSLGYSLVKQERVPTGPDFNARDIFGMLSGAQALNWFDQLIAAPSSRTVHIQDRMLHIWSPV
jgi:xanthosine utilization system XapX-like protein